MGKELTNERFRQVEQIQEVLRQNIKESERLIESSCALLAKNRRAPDRAEPTD